MSSFTRRRSRSGVLVVSLVLVSLTLITLDVGLSRPGPVEAVRTGAGTVTEFLQRTGASIFRPDTEVRALDAENARLRVENELLRARLAETGSVARFDRAGFRLVPAHVIGYGPAYAYAHTLALDAGTDDGVRVDSTVLAADGLVGRVLRAGRTTSTVLLLCDAESTVGARLSGNRELGLLDGSGGCGDRDTANLRLLDLSAGVRVDDDVVSFGSPGARPYVPDVPIGRIATEPSDTSGAVRLATVDPAVDFTALDQVSVVVGND